MTLVPATTFELKRDSEARRYEAILRRYKHPDQKIARDEMRAAGRCINGPRSGDPHAPSKYGVIHGEVVSGGKCQRCLDVHKGKHKR